MRALDVASSFEAKIRPSRECAYFHPKRSDRLHILSTSHHDRRVVACLGHTDSQGKIRCPADHTGKKAKVFWIEN